MAWVLDLDGVVWLGKEPVPRAAGAVATLRDRGERVLFVTNNSAAPIAEVEARLAAMSVPAEGDVVTSAEATAALLEPGSTALVCAGPGVADALARRGVHTVREGDADAVVVGWHTDFDYERLTAALHAVRHGARLLGTNDDATYPTPGEPLPGGGAILAAVAYAAGATPTVAGKPHPPMAELVRVRAGEPVGWVVGDRPETDGALAGQLGARFGLVLSGVTASARGVEPPPHAVGADLDELVGRVLGAGPHR